MRHRIAIVTHDLSPGGLATMTQFLYHALKDSGLYQPEIITLATSFGDAASMRLRAPATWRRGLKVERHSWNELEYTHVGAWGSELELQRYQPRAPLTKLLKQYDLIQFVVGSAPWAQVAFETGRPVMIWTATTTRADRESRVRSAPLGRRAWGSLMIPLVEHREGRALRRAHTVFALSDYTRRIVQPLMGRKRALLAPCGVDTTRFSPTQTQSENYILCVARLSDARKSVSLLLKAYASLQGKLKSSPDLYLVGDPPSESAQTLLKRLGLSDKVRLLGTKRGEELANLYRNAAFFVLSSDEEGLAIVVLEAMASGLAVVCTACGGPETAITHGKTGLLSPVGDVEAMALSLRNLIENPDLRRSMGQAGRRVAEERFSVQAVSKIFIDRYNSILARGESPLSRH